MFLVLCAASSLTLVMIFSVHSTHQNRISPDWARLVHRWTDRPDLSDREPPTLDSSPRGSCRNVTVDGKISSPGERFKVLWPACFFFDQTAASSFCNAIRIIEKRPLPKGWLFDGPSMGQLPITTGGTVLGPVALN